MRAIRSAYGIAKVLGMIVLFVLGFATTAALVRSVLVLPFGLPGSTKLEIFRQDRNEIDLLYFGSSYFAHGLDPAVIDTTLSQELERPVRSFNLGIPGASGLEIDYLIRSLLRTPAARLRWVVIETPFFEGRIPDRWRNLSPRMVYWHSARQTRTALAQLAGADVSAEETRELALLHLRHFGIRETNLGRGEELFRSLTGLRPPLYQILIDTARETQGFASLEVLKKFPGLAERRLEFENRPQKYARTLKRFRPEAIERVHKYYPVAVLAAQIQFLESRGITPIYVAPPNLKPAGGFRRFARESIIRHLLVYSDPKRYPDLYRLSSRWDTHHTSERGTLLWSKLLAHDLAQLIRRQEAAP